MLNWNISGMQTEIDEEVLEFKVIQMTKIINLSDKTAGVGLTLPQMIEKITKELDEYDYTCGLVILTSKDGLMRFFVGGSANKYEEINLLIDEFKSHLMNDEFDVNL